MSSLSRNSSKERESIKLEGEEGEIQEEKKAIHKEYQDFLKSGLTTESKEFLELRKRIYEINSRCKRVENEQFLEMMTQHSSGGLDTPSSTARRRGGV